MGLNALASEANKSLMQISVLVAELLNHRCLFSLGLLQIRIYARLMTKVGVRLPDETTVNVLDNKHLEAQFPAGLNTTFTLFDVVLPSGLPTGTWKFEGTLLEPDLGETFSRSVKPFEVVP